MEGSLFFMVDLVRHFPPKTEIKCARIKSYQGNRSTGQLIGLDTLGDHYSGKHILLIDDIFDTGLTAQSVSEKILALGAADVRIAVLLHKHTKPSTSRARPDWVGFSIEDKFVIGYGLDLDGAYRNLPSIRYLETT